MITLLRPEPRYFKLLLHPSIYDQNIRKVVRTLSFLHKTSSPAEMRPTLIPRCTTRTANPPLAWLFSKGIRVTGPSSTLYLLGPETWKTFGAGFEGLLGVDRGGEIGMARVNGGDGGGVGVLDRDWFRFPSLSSFTRIGFDVSVLGLASFDNKGVFLNSLASVFGIRSILIFKS
jgi:hypothetical protein